MFSTAFLTFVALAASVQASCIHGTSLMRRQEGEVKISDFSYTGETGPLNWAGISPDNIACRTATVQSPIAVTEELAPFATEVPVIAFNNVAEAEFENIGTTVEVIASGTTTFAGANFTLKQFHFHTPSEHRINEEYFPVEVHFVHEAADGSGAIAVISVMFQLSEDNTTTDLITKVIQNIAQIQTPGTATTTGPLDFTEVAAAVTAGPIHQYTGSLTTPPCAEGLTFLILAKPLPINVATFNTLKSTIKFNARYTQNTPGQTNLLQVAADLAIREAGLDVAGGGAAAVGNGTAVSEVDVAAIVEGILAGNQNVKFETVTTTHTTVVAVGAGEAGQIGEAGGAQAGEGEVKNEGQGEVKNEGQGEVKNEPPVNGAVEGQHGAAVDPYAAALGDHSPIIPKLVPKDTDSFRLSKIARSRIGRRFVGKRRL